MSFTPPDGGPDAPPRRRRGGVAARMTGGAALFLGANVATRVLGVITLAVLARLLTPADFGVIALAVFVTGLADSLLGRHIETAVIRAREVGTDRLDTAFTLALTWGVVAAVAMVALAGPLAALLGAPQMVDALRWLALAPAIDGLRNPHFTLYERALTFRYAALVEATSRLALSAVSIALAFLWRDYWAAIAGLIALSAARTAATYVLAPGRPGLSLTHWREFLGFSGWLMATGVARYLNTRIDRAIVAAQIGVAAAGFYRMGAEIASMATQEMSRPMKRVVIPGLAAAADEQVRLREGFRRTRAVILGVVLPIGVGTALVAQEAVRVVAGPGWETAATVVQWLAPAMALAALNSAAQALITVRGETRALFLRNAGVLLVTVAALFAGIAALGLQGALYARVATIALLSAVTMAIARKYTGERLLDPLRLGWRSLAAAAAMMAAVLALDAAGGAVWAWAWAGDDVAQAMARLAVKAVTGAAVYGGGHLALWALSGRPDGVERFALGVATDALRRLARQLRFT